MLYLYLSIYLFHSLYFCFPLFFLGHFGLFINVFFISGNGLKWAWVFSFPRFLDHHNDAPQSAGLLWTSDQFVAETSTWQNTQHSQHTNLHVPVGFEPTISSGERPQTYALDRAATETGFHLLLASITRISYGPGSVAGIATAYGLDGPGIEFR